MKYFFRFITFLFFLSLIILQSCSHAANSDEVETFFETYSYAAKISRVSFSGKHALGKDGAENIPSGNDYSIYFDISNPGNFQLDASVDFNSSIEADFTFNAIENRITLTYSDSDLTPIDGADENDISPTITLRRAGNPNDDSLIEDVFSLKLKCNTAPKSVLSGDGRMYSDSNSPSTFTNRLILCAEIPSPNTDFSLLSVNANGTTHNFTISNGVFSKGSGESWDIQSSPPTGIKGIFDGQVDFSGSNGGSVVYIITNIDNISSKLPFPVTYTIYDKGGVPSVPATFNSHVRKLEKARTNAPDDVLLVESNGKANLILYTPTANPNATIYYTITDLKTTPETTIISSNKVGNVTIPIEIPNGETERKIKVYATVSQYNFESSEELQQTITIKKSSNNLTLNVLTPENILITTDVLGTITKGQKITFTATKTTQPTNLDVKDWKIELFYNYGSYCVLSSNTNSITIPNNVDTGFYSALVSIDYMENGILTGTNGTIKLSFN